MNSRERVLAAVNHQEPDRVPLDLGTSDTFIAREVYEGMAAILGIEPTAARGVAHPGAFVTPDEKMLEILGADVRLVNAPARKGVPSPWDPPPVEEVLPDGGRQWISRDGSIRRQPAGASDVQLLQPAITGDLTQAEIDRVFPPAPAIGDWVDAEAMRETIRRHQCSTGILPVSSSSKQQKEKQRQDRAGTALERMGKMPMPHAGETPAPHCGPYAVQTNFIIMPITFTSFGPLTFERWCLELALQPDLICRLMDAMMEHLFAGGESFYKAAGADSDLVYGLGDDVATHTNMWLSPADYRRYVKPRHEKIIQYIKKRTKAKIIFHCCGACMDVIGDLIEVGVDVLNPTQTSAAGMDPFELKRRFGKDITFWGGIDVIHLLPKGTVADVEREVKRHIDALAPGGGYVFSPSHIIQRFTPPENVLTMYRVAREYH
jgi:uroporphyrinogen decarboxylase